MVRILRLFLYVLSYLVVVIFGAIVNLGHKVPYLSLVVLSQPYLIPLADFVGRGIMDFVRKE